MDEENKRRLGGKWNGEAGALSPGGGGEGRTSSTTCAPRRGPSYFLPVVSALRLAQRPSCWGRKLLQGKGQRPERGWVLAKGVHKEADGYYFVFYGQKRRKRNISCIFTIARTFVCYFIESLTNAEVS